MKRWQPLFFTFILFISVIWSIPVSHGMLMPPSDGEITLRNLHLHEELTVKFRTSNGSYNPKALDQINHLLRCRHTNEPHQMSKALLDLVDQIQDHFGKKEIQVISAYRSPTLNALLRAEGRKVASNSLHMYGLAMDIRIAGVSTKELRDYALSLKKGGVGYYPSKQFVHVDVGRVRSW